MDPHVPDAIHQQVTRARDVIQRRLATNLLAIYLYGSALDGGLKPLSDIDLLVIVSESPDDAMLRRLQQDLLSISAPPGLHPALRALEVTVIARDQLVHWRHPARRELQFGEWLRQDILAGSVEPRMQDPDLAILLTKARQHGVALHGPPVIDLLPAIPDHDFRQALADTLALWNAPEDWRGEEANIVLTLARIWYSARTGRIAAKDVAADWLLQQLPEHHRAIVIRARRAYLGHADHDAPWPAAPLADFIHAAKAHITLLLSQSNH